MANELEQPIQDICISCKNNFQDSCSRGLSRPEYPDRCTTQHTEIGEVRYEELRIKVLDESGTHSFRYSFEVMKPK